MKRFFFVINMVKICWFYFLLILIISRGNCGSGSVKYFNRRLLFLNCVFQFLVVLVKIKSLKRFLVLRCLRLLSVWVHLVCYVGFITFIRLPLNKVMPCLSSVMPCIYRHVSMRCIFHLSYQSGVKAIHQP